MAHNLPPKVPNVTQNWNDFSHQQISSMEILATKNATTRQESSWVDEFLDFSSVRRRGHRRSVSESIAFLEAPMVQECRRSSIAAGSGNTSEFERFDDDQLMSMFTDDVVMGPTLSSSSPSSPSDHNSINDDKQGPLDQLVQQPKSEPEEVHSSCKSEEQNAQHATADNSNEKIYDPKRIKRILANRQSAQRSRVRKLQYISELERSVNTLQAEVSVLSPRVAFLDHQRLVLNVDNSVLKQRIAALAQDKLFKDGKNLCCT
ncbi:basic leucine zipper 61-like [Olea europaea subsp. europaea]|uniref:Basic leucine zipper 61-like n=1 Tax=Olea europaea subsp. europaea TaxID=158383 RepID=A0A8S0PPU6_OLEEU|nr:basic leucine zipper 61-like [Olea europaea subsp. europaea]